MERVGDVVAPGQQQQQAPQAQPQATLATARAPTPRMRSPRGSNESASRHGAGGETTARGEGSSMATMAKMIASVARRRRLSAVADTMFREASVAGAVDLRIPSTWAPEAVAAAAEAAAEGQGGGGGGRNSALSTSKGGRRARSVGSVNGGGGGERGASRVAAARAAYAAPPRMETVQHTALRIINIGTVSLYDVLGEAQARRGNGGGEEVSLYEVLGEAQARRGVGAPDAR